VIRDWHSPAFASQRLTLRVGFRERAGLQGESLTVRQLAIVQEARLLSGSGLINRKRHRASVNILKSGEMNLTRKSGGRHV